MTIFFFACLFVLGLALGSFLNVLTIRYLPDGKLFDFKNLSGRSRCVSCGKTLNAKELVPLFSFLFLRGRCSSCKGKISLQYPLVEFISGAICAGVPFFFNSFFGVSNFAFASFLAPLWYYPFLFLWVFIFLILLAIFIIDLKHYIVPNELNLALLVFGIVLSLLFFFNEADVLPFRESFLKNYSLVFSPFQGALYNHLLGLFAGGAIFSFLFFVSRGRGMGMGDVKLAFAGGMVVGWPDIGLVTMIAFILGGIWASVLYFSKAKTMKDKLPFAPFFVFGFVITVFFGFSLMKAYFGLFNL